MTSAPDDLPLVKRAWLVVGLLWVVGCLNYLDRVMIITMRGSIKEAIPMTDAQFGLLTTVFLITYGVLSPFGGFLADRFSRTRIIIFSLIAWSATTWLTAQATTLGELLATRALMGVSEACYFPAALALIADYHRNKTRSLANGLHLSGVMVGSGLGGLGGWLAGGHGWKFAFELFGGGGVLYALVLRPPPHGAGDRAPRPAGRGDPQPLQSKCLHPRAGLLGPARPLELVVHRLAADLSQRTFPAHPGEIRAAHDGLHLQRQPPRHDHRRRLGRPLEPDADPGPGLGRRDRTFHRRARRAARRPRQRARPRARGTFTRSWPDANMMPIICQIADPRYRATGLGLLNAFATIVGGLTIYAGGVLRDAHVDIIHVFECGAAGLLVCTVLLWCIRPRVVA
jgi:hypothetical protein